LRRRGTGEEIFRRSKTGISGIRITLDLNRGICGADSINGQKARSVSCRLAAPRFGEKVERRPTFFGGLRLSFRDPELPRTSQANGWSVLQGLQQGIFKGGMWTS
jgi:hypothetical protein